MVQRLVALAVVLIASVTIAARQPAPVRSGLDLAGMDRAVRPQDDLFRFANGRWLATADIPPDRTTYGTFIELTDKTELALRELIEDVARRPRGRAGSPEQQIADLYTSAMDVARINALGTEPIREVLARIDAIQTPRDLATVAGELTATAAGGPFAVAVVVDARDPTRLVAQVSQGGTLLPSRDYYLGDGSPFVEARAEYARYLAAVFRLAHRPAESVDAEAQAVVAFEQALARVQLDPVAVRAVSPISRSLDGIREACPGFDWAAWARPQGVHLAAEVSLMQPAFFTAFGALSARTPVDTMKGWLRGRFLTAMAPLLTESFWMTRFAFFGTVLNGQTLPRDRWKVAVSLVSSYLGDAIGRLYVERYFSPRARTKAERIVGTVTRAYGETIDDAAWLSRATRSEAVAKLDRLEPRVGMPRTWRDYSRLVITPGDFFGNIARARRFDGDYRLARASGARPSEWIVSPQTVNAFYNPALNQILLPAAILQPPHFDAEADDAVNFGALGATVGHEITHAFDERGRHYDADGVVRRWWPPAETGELVQRELALAAQFDRYRLLGEAVNGTLTRSENSADLIGLAVAWRAYQRSLDGRPAPVIDGFTGAQRFFLAYARMWRMKGRDDYMRQWLLTQPHAPYEFRTNGAVSNLGAFHDAFGVTNTDALFRPPAGRIPIW